MITKEEAYAEFDHGWHKLLSFAFDAVDTLPEHCPVDTITRRFGMLSVKYHRPEMLSEIHHFILDSIEYKLERISVIVCETCGASGRRRHDLAKLQVLCTTHFALQYSAEHPAPSLMAHQEPQKEY